MPAWMASALESALDFSRVLNASIAASWLVGAVLVLRLALRRAPKWTHVALWGLVALRLALPAFPESPLSLLPSAETVPQAMLQSQGDQLFQPAHLALVSNPLYAGGVTVELDRTVGGLQLDLTLLTPVWLAGMAVLAAYTAVSYGRLRRRVRTAVRYGSNIYQSEQVRSPFVLGVLRPRIYLPFRLERRELNYVIAHERAHIRRKDHWWKPLGFLLLVVHWFNPLLWLAYALFCRDIELACDERVIRELDNGQKADYTQALLACSVDRRLLAPCPLAFGEVGVKERVRAVMHYKKPAFWLVLLALAACVAAAVFFLTVPPAEEASDGPEAGQTGGPAAPAAESGGADEAEPIALTEESAAACIAQVLGSLTVHSDNSVSFALPESIPVSTEDLTRLTITLNATYATDTATYRVDHLLEDEVFWQGGETFQRALDGEGTLVGLMLRVAFMTQVEENAYQEYAANYLELSAPFTYDTPAGFAEPAVEIGTDGSLAYTLKTGAVTVRMPLPEGFGWQAAEQAGYDAPVLLLTRDGDTVGSLALVGLGTTDRQALETVDTAADELPMPVFSLVALSNHAGYEDYRVRRAWATGAAATAQYVWQDLEAAEGNAASLPWQEMDCVLGYDWEAAPYFVQLLADTGVLTEAERIALAEGLTITADGAQ